MKEEKTEFMGCHIKVIERLAIVETLLKNHLHTHDKMFYGLLIPLVAGVGVVLFKLFVLKIN